MKYNFIKWLLHNSRCAADLANALGIVVAGSGRRLENSGANEEIVADFDCEKQASACRLAVTNNEPNCSLERRTNRHLLRPCGCPY